ncbi:uncharacterized protein LOC125245082 [Megalobrama amblycephala]|uniref:uncharacterized protein LOC125245082 n=1 Tax=Megalobrama amblycephala TaxID=75352 RepID=UPI0020142CBA|nr:uncharacterized protein LOC125245082 [Megalobrama amblycephala]
MQALSGCRRPPPYNAAGEEEVGQVPVAGSSAEPCSRKGEVKTEDESSDDDEDERDAGVYQEVRRLLNEAMTPELREPLSRVFKGVKRKAGKPPLTYPMKTRSVSVIGKKTEKTCNLPMLQFPGAEGPVWVERPWDLEELRNVTAALPDPEKGVERFISAVTNVDVTYKPTGRDWSAIFSARLGLKWTEVRGAGEDAFNPALQRLDEGRTETQEWRVQWTAMLERLRLAYPLRPDWAAIANTKQLKGETVTAYLARLKTVVDECAGLPEGTDNTGVLKYHFVNGLLPNIQKAVKLTCIGWEAQNLEVVMQHAKHAEQNDEKRNTEKQQKLENAQYMFYQSQSNNQMPRDDNYQEARRGRGRGRGRWNAQNGRIGDRDRCRICGQRGHWSRECPDNPSNFPQQQQYQNNFRQQPQQSYPQQRQNYREQQHTSSFPPPPPTASSTA